MATDQIKKVPKPPMIKMWNFGNIIGANLNIMYPDNPPGIQINEFPIHQYIDNDSDNTTYEDNKQSSVIQLDGHQLI